MSNGQTTVATTGPDSRTTDPTRLTTEALMREIDVINKSMDLRFGFFASQMEAANDQRLEQKADTKEAVNAALAAAKEAVREQQAATKEAIGKSEAIFYTTIEQLKEDMVVIKQFKDNSMGRQTATIALVGVIFAAISLALRFL